MGTKYGEDIAVLKEQMNQTVLPALTRIEKKLDTTIATKADRSELRTFKWITLTSTIVLTAVISGLVFFYLSNRHSLSEIPQPSTSSSTTSTTNNTAPASSGTASQPSSSSNPTPTPSNSSSGGLQVTVPKATL